MIERVRERKREIVCVLWQGRERDAERKREREEGNGHSYERRMARRLIL